MDRLIRLKDIPEALKENSENILEYFGEKTYLKKTYSEVYKDLMKTLAFISKHKLERGDRIGIIGSNSYEYILIDLAAIMKGYVTVPFPEKDFKNRIGSLIKDYGLKLLFADTKYLEDHGAQSIYNLNSLPELIENENPDVGELEPAEGEEVFTVIFTSGTTGFPKGIEMRAKCVEEWIGGLLDRFEFYRDDKVIDFLPLSISNARLFVYGAILIKFNLALAMPEQLLRVLYISGPTILQGVPYLFETIYGNIIKTIKSSFITYFLFRLYSAIKRILPSKAAAGIQKKLFNKALDFWGGRMRIMVTGSAPISKKVLKFYEDIGLKIYEAYGINEIGLVSINSPGAYRIGSVGKPFPTKEIKISDTGEILIRSDYSWGRGYINDSQSFGSQVFREDGFVSTGDTGYFDKDGFLYIEGRLKEVLVLTNGEKIHPNIIEEGLKDSQYIRQAVAIGDKKPFVTCVIVSDGGEKTSMLKIQEAIDSVNKKLPETLNIKKYIMAKEPFTVENGLMNSTLKLNRNKIYKQYKDEIENLYK